MKNKTIVISPYDSFHEFIRTFEREPGAVELNQSKFEEAPERETKGAIKVATHDEQLAHVLAKYVPVVCYYPFDSGVLKAATDHFDVVKVYPRSSFKLITRGHGVSLQECKVPFCELPGGKNAEEDTAEKMRELWAALKKEFYEPRNKQEEHAESCL